MIQTQTDIFYDRKAVKQYDSSYKLSQTEVEALLEKANRAPSAWNLQHWKYLVVQSDEAKEKLLPIAFNQSQVREASVTVVILADKEANKNVEAVFGKSVKNGFMTKEIKESLTQQINGAHKNPEYGFEAGVLNSSLAAMQLINAATLAGLGTCAIGGFRRTDLIEAFDIEDRYLPTMLITIGKSAHEPRETSRLSVDETATFV